MSPGAAPSGFDVAIVGGGVIGCGLARELAGRGARVAVIERASPGAEASSAAAGLLAPQAEATAPGPLLDLGLESRRLHARWAEELAIETGIDVGYKDCGVLRCSFPGATSLWETFGWQKDAGLSIETETAAGAASRTGGRVSREIHEALFFPDEAFVDSALLTRALALSGEKRGVRLLSGVSARRFVIRGGECTGVETAEGTLEADRVVNAAGAWAAFDRTLSFSIPVEPVRGQIVELAPGGASLPTVVQDDDVYLVPRPDGRVLAGATVEHVGFRKEVTARGIATLTAAAMRLVPDLSEAAFLRAWAGLRPGTPDGLPILGASPLPRLFLAVGHFRNGTLLAPVTARAMADLLSGGQARRLAPFSISRFRSEGAPDSSTVFPGSGVSR